MAGMYIDAETTSIMLIFEDRSWLDEAIACWDGGKSLAIGKFPSGLLLSLTDL